ncbi:MAG: TRAP transporter small permease [Syntrophomonadaceae bacterium]
MNEDLLEIIDNGLNKVIKVTLYIAEIAIFAIMIAVVLTAFGRYVLGYMIIPGLYEITGFYLMPLAIFFSFASSYMSGTFPYINNIILKCPRRIQHLAKLFCLFAETVLFTVVTYYTLQFALIGTAKKIAIRAGTELWPLYPFYYIAPIGFGLMMLKAFILFLKQIKNEEDVISASDAMID